jgi:hypothetical protein
MRTVKTATAAGLLLAAVTACSSSSPAPAASNVAASSAQASASVASSPSASGLGVAIGTAQSASALGVTIKATTTSYTVVTLTGSNQETLPAGTKVAIIQAQGCVTANTSGSQVAMTWKPWTLVTSTGATVQPLSVYGTKDWPGSLYPNDSTTATPAGRCRTGLIPFSLAGASGVPVAVEYNVHGVVLDWALGWFK